MISSLWLTCALAGVLWVLATGSGNATEADSLPASGTSLRLWQGEAPGAQGKEDIDVPTLTVYAPPEGKRTGASVVICPGGGYVTLAPHEGKPVADWLNTLGVTGIVLKYRLGPKYHHPVMLHDAARAIRMVRAHAGEWGLDPNRIGVLGFSAGGHLASTIATHFDAGDPNAADPVDRVSSRPDAAILIYPVITLTGPFAHEFSREMLLGKTPDPKLVELLSNQTQITPQTPPTFLVHTAGDTGVPLENSLLFIEGLRKAKVPVEFHLYAPGQHGFGMAPDDPVLSDWPKACAKWLNGRGFLKMADETKH